MVTGRGKAKVGKRSHIRPIPFLPRVPNSQCGLKAHLCYYSRITPLRITAVHLRTKRHVEAIIAGPKKKQSIGRYRYVDPSCRIEDCNYTSYYPPLPILGTGSPPIFDDEPEGASAVYGRKECKRVRYGAML